MTRRARWQKLCLALISVGSLTAVALKVLDANPDAAAASYGSFALAIVGVMGAFGAANVGEHKVNP